MLQENYTIIIPLVFAIIAVLVKLLSRRNDDDSQIRNDTCIGQSLMLGALSASLIFAANAQQAVTDLKESIKQKEIAIRQAKDREKTGEGSIEDLAIIEKYDKEMSRELKRVEMVSGSVSLAVLCVMLVLSFALIDRFKAFKVVDANATCKTYKRTWWWWAALNLVGLLGFITVLFFTKPGK